MKRKNIYSHKYKDLLFQENNEEIFYKIREESININTDFIDFMKFSNRYLYCIQKS